MRAASLAIAMVVAADPVTAVAQQHDPDEVDVIVKDDTERRLRRSYVIPLVETIGGTVVASSSRPFAVMALSRRSIVSRWANADWWR